MAIAVDNLADAENLTKIDEEEKKNKKELKKLKRLRKRTTPGGDEIVDPNAAIDAANSR